jgi:ubiquitin-protein ligase
MVQWYKINQRLFREEKAALACKHPSLILEILSAGTPINKYVSMPREEAVLRGMYSLQVPDTTRKYDYSVALRVPDDYPKHPPVMYCNDPKLPINIDRHILKNGQACLGVTTEVRRKWSAAPNMVSFVDEFVGPFLAWQIFFDAYGCPPAWGQRSHDKKGVLEFYADILGLEVDANIVGFMRLLARKNIPGGHEMCPCESGRRLRTCHKDAVHAARQHVEWTDAKSDLLLLERQDSDTTVKK